MTTQQKIQLIKRYLPLLGPPLLIVAVFFLLLRPAYLSLNRIKKEIVAGQIDLQESRAIVAGKKEAFVVLQETQKKAGFYRIYFSPLEETDILRRMAKIANRSDISYSKLTSLSQPPAATPASSTPGQAPPPAQFDIRPFTLTFKASYTQFSDVLTQLAKLDRFVTVRSFKIDTKEDKGNPQPYNPRAELTVDFYFRPVKTETAKPEPQKSLPTPHFIPPPPMGRNKVGEATYYTVSPGDSLSKIAHKHGMSVPELRKLNDIPKKRSLIKPGDRIKVKKD